MPEYLWGIENKLESFSKSSMEVKYYYLKHLIENNPGPKGISNSTLIKIYIEKSIELLKYLSYVDCSHYFYNDKNKNENKYETCRNNKRKGIKSIKDSLNLIINLAKTIKTIFKYIEAKDYEEKLKYILLILKELTNNEDSYEKEWSSVVVNFAIMLQEQFDEYWPIVFEQLKNDSNYLSYIKEFKKEVLVSIFEILTSIPRIIHFDEKDGFLKDKISKTGLNLDEQSINVQNSIIAFSKKMKELDGSYYLSGDTFFENIHLWENKTEIKINDDLYLEINSTYFLKNNNYTLQIYSFDSPLVSIKLQKNPKKTFNISNIFISITVLNEEGEEIPMNNIEPSYRPKILYNKDKYKDLKGCFYYNKADHTLENVGMFFDDQYTKNNKNYYKCESDHLNLSIFTIGTFPDIEEDDGLEIWQKILILLGLLIVILLIITIIAHFKNKKNKITSENIGSNFDDRDEGLMKEELY